ncbi:MAG: thioredoxin family protein [Nibricoccus sp.]
MNRYLLVTLIAVVAIFLSRAQKFKSAGPDVVTEERLAKIFENTNEKVVLYFWQPDCAPSKSVTPMIEEVASSYPKLKVLKINTANPDNREIHDAYSIHSTPTIVVMQKNKFVSQWIGPFKDKNQLITFLKPSSAY